MLYEYRLYEVAPGQLDKLHCRFMETTLPLWRQYDIQPVGFWLPLIGTNNRLHYILRWSSLAEREDKWSTFFADCNWQKAFKKSEEDGPLTRRIVNEIWTPTAYSSVDQYLDK